ncbi:hypothetical protein ACP4OV_027455 [Aristida adscensionis]
MKLSQWLVFLSSLLAQAFSILADTNKDDLSGLHGIAGSWNTKLSSWSGIDPCGGSWIGISCTGNRVTSITLSTLGLSGTLSGDIQSLSELQYLTAIQGFMKIALLSKIIVSAQPSSSRLRYIMITKTHASCEQSLNNNKFNGPIPRSLGRIANLNWLDLANNTLTGELPVFNGIDTGLDNLTNAKHLLLDNNFSGSIPPTLGLLDKLEVLRLDNNYLTGLVPATIANLTRLQELHLANNNFTGPLPDLTGLKSLCFVDMSNNSFNSSFNSSYAPAWFTTLSSLTSLYLENLHVPGHLPQPLFSLNVIQTLRLRGNNFSGTLEIGPDFSTQLQLIDLKDNQITTYTVGAREYKNTLILFGNPFCNQGSTDRYCTPTGQSNPTMPRSYATPQECYEQPPICLADQLLSPSCICAAPYKGTLVFRSPPFSDVTNASHSYFIQLEKDMKDKFAAHNVPVDSISIHDARFDAASNMKMILEVYPSGKTRFSAQDITRLGFLLSNQTYKPPLPFGPYIFIGQNSLPSDAVFSSPDGHKTNRVPVIIGVSVGSVALVAIAVVLALVIVVVRRKRRPNQTEERSQSFVSWDIKSTSDSVPHPRGARMFTFDELKKITNNFSEVNDIGNGGYGKVYRGTLPSGQLVAVKRSQQGSLQGSLEFRTEIELLSRVHHKNVVSLVGFCLDQGEQMLVYEYIPNGTRKESLTGKSGVRLDWRRRLGVVLGAAKGIAYLHELADPPIVHRDIKSSNVLLDERLNAKVSDFGLSKTLGMDGRDQVTTQVKGTMGYLDPEYYMTQQLTEKSDVYSFGVLMLEVITARKPLERGRYIVREVKAALDRTKDLYGLQVLLDPALGASPMPLAGLEQYVDLALRCIEEVGADRPSMGEAVSEIERLLKMAGVGPDSASNSMSYTSRTPRHPYNDSSSFNYSGGGMPSSRVEPK